MADKKSDVHRVTKTGKRKKAYGNVVENVEPDSASRNRRARRKANSKSEMNDPTVPNEKRLTAGRDVARKTMAEAASKGLEKSDKKKAKKKTSAAKRWQNQK